MQGIKEKQNNAFATLKGPLGISNPMQSPRITKVVVSVGTGSLKDKKKLELVADRVTKITGQKPATRGAKKSIASFKVRQGDLVGYQVTLRGPRMYGFLNKLLNIALPRTRDFRGITKGAIDHIGNITIGIKEHTIFPETADEDIKDIFGMAITIVTTAKTRADAHAFFTYMGIPFKKDETKEGK